MTALIHWAIELFCLGVILTVAFLIIEDRRMERRKQRADREHVARTATALGIGNYRYPTQQLGVTRDRAVRGGLVEDLLFEKRRQIELDRADFDLWRLECRDHRGEAS